MSGFYWIKPTKLAENDSLYFLHILSSPFYTISLFVVLLFICNNKTNVIRLNSLLFIVIFYFLYDAGFHNYAIVYIQNNNLNTSLQNGLLNIHPPLIYYMYVSTAHLWIIFYLFSNNSKFTLKSSSYLYSINILSLFGIYLGALWASQELNWGGFWSWDPVEIASLVSMLFVSKLLHHRENSFSNKRFFFYIIIMWIFYIIIRLGVVNTIHSFIRSNSVSLYIHVSIIFVLLYYGTYILTTFNKEFSFEMYYFIKHICKPQVSVLFFYTCLYLLYLVVPNYVFITLFSLSNFFILFFLVFIIYMIIYDFYGFNAGYKGPNPLTKFKYIGTYSILVIYYISNFKLSILLLLLFIFILTRLLIVYSATHALFMCIYNIYFIFTTNIPNYNSKIIFSPHIFSTSNSFISNGGNGAYETIFFLKKSFFILKPKSLLIHINGFNIFSNGTLSTYLFSKNFFIKSLFSIEFVYTTFFLTLLVLGFFIRVSFIMSNLLRSILNY